MEEKKELLDQDERVVEIELERLRGFVNHPFKVQADSQMIELQESIKKYGILNPLIVRPRQDGTYEIISGHRRKFAAEKIGYRKVPVIIRVLKDDESVAYVVCQHYGINTSDYSFSYVAGWSEGKETPELKASLDKIRQTASEFIYQIDQKMEVLMADKDQVQESAKERSPFAQELMDKITEGAKDMGFIPVVPETQEKTVNPELKVVVDKALKDLDKKRTLSKVKESVKSKLKANTEKAEQAPKKSRTSKAKEERA